MILWPVLCRSPNGGMEVFGAEMAVSGGHLDGRVAENSAQVVEIATCLHEPRGKCVPEVVPP